MPADTPSPREPQSAFFAVPRPRESTAHYDVVVLGAGYAGLTAALRLRRSGLKVALVSERPEFVERVRLQESLVRPIAPRLPPLAQWLRPAGIDFICGHVAEIFAALRTVIVDTGEHALPIEFTDCIYALGSRIDVRGTKGAAEHAFRLDPGSGSRSAEGLRHWLGEAPAGRQVIVVGGGNTAVEAAAEIKARRPDFDVTMIASHGAGDFGKGEELARTVRAELSRQEIRLVDAKSVREVQADCVIASGGERLPADCVVWAGGLRSPDIAAAAGIAVDGTNRVLVDGGLRSISHPHILAVGDAAKPVGPTGAAYRPSALAALTSAAYAARSLVKKARGKRSRPYSFSAFGQGVAIGRHGVGFFTFPDDGNAYWVIGGRFALRLRNLIVRVLVWFLQLERRWPGLEPYWIGRSRLSWRDISESAAAHRAMTERHEPQSQPSLFASGKEQQ